MKYRHRTQTGFTLIELLVVVLIIGVLAAIAIPQYNKAVLRARVGGILPKVAALYQAYQMYELENQQKPDADLPNYATQAKVEEVLGVNIPLGNNMLFLNTGNVIGIRYEIPSVISLQITKGTGADYSYYENPFNQKGAFTCSGYSGFAGPDALEKGKAICQSVCGPLSVYNGIYYCVI